MRKLTVQENQVSYRAQFSEPAVSAWGEGKKILDGLLTTFVKQRISLADIHIDVSSQELSGHSVTVNFGPLCSYKFHLDHIEFTGNNCNRDSFPLLPEILEQGDAWLRRMIPEFSFQSHLFTYYGHCSLSEGDSKDVLRALPTASIPDIGESEGNGIIFHWITPKEKWKIQLLIDHSLRVTDGLFLQFFLLVMGDTVNYRQIALTGQHIMEVALTKIGLEISNGA